MDSKPSGIQLYQPDRFSASGLDSNNKTALARVEDRPEAPKQDLAKSNFDKKIEDARKQGREFLARGIEKVKDKIALLKAKIKAMPGAIAKVAEDAVAEAFTIPARIENAVDALSQKIADAEANMKARIEAAKAKFEARKQDLIKRTKEAIARIKERSGNFFSRIKESLFSSSRKREMKDMVEMLSLLLAKAEEGSFMITPEQFNAVRDGLLAISEKHRKNSTQLQDLMKTIFSQRRQTGLLLGAT